MNTKPLIRLRSALLAPFGAMFLAPGAHASGLQTATGHMTEWSGWLMAFIAAAAVCYLLYIVVLIKLEMKRWSDFMWGVFGFGVAGAVPILVPYAMSFFTS